MSAITLVRVPAAQGLSWVKVGWQLFRHAPVPWAGMTALVFLVLLAVGALPYAGAVLVHALSPFIVAGYMAASRAAAQGEPVTFLYLATGFRDARKPLLIMGLAYMLAMVLVFRLVAFLTDADLSLLMAQVERPHQLTPEEANALLQTLMPAFALISLLLTPLLMATWFSPGLALFEGFSPAKAVWWSLWACGVNWRPLLVYSLTLSLLGMLAVVIPMGLGLLVFIPWTLASTYAAYVGIFAVEAAP